MKMPVLMLCFLIAACDAIPRDPAGTADRVKADRAFNLGLIEGEGSRSDDASRFVARLSAATGARPRIERGSAESLLLKLEAGNLDLVVGAMATKSPWATKVHVLPAFDSAEGPGGPVHLVAMARNGENRWISIAHKEAMAMQARP